MVSTRLARRAVSSIAAVMAASLLLSASSCSSPVSTSHVRADEKEDGEAADPEFNIPDGTPAEIIAQVKKLAAARQDKGQKFASREDFVNNEIKFHRALIAAGDKILAQKSEDKEAELGAQLKLEAISILASNQVDNAAKEALEAVAKLKADQREVVAKAAGKFWVPIRIACVASLSDGERKTLEEEVVEAVKTSSFSQESVGNANKLSEFLAMANHADEAGQLFESLAKLSAESSDPKFHPNAARFAAMARRIKLPGSFMEVEGKLLDGSEFDWAAYRGKVVLIDFWATWCGPCIAEIPNVKKNYKKYHDKGFEVVGISLDNARYPLEKFIASEEIPWAQLYDTDLQRGSGWKHPMAVKYAINGIPAAILVDKEGKVVSMAARAEILSELLEKLLGPAE